MTNSKGGKTNQGRASSKLKQSKVKQRVGSKFCFIITNLLSKLKTNSVILLILKIYAKMNPDNKGPD